MFKKVSMELFITHDMDLNVFAQPQKPYGDP